jgi:DNA-binding transcriptional LysR family regulator
MDIRSLTYLDAVARTGSFTAAAAELNVVQPAISQQIKRLEEELGVALIDRATRQPTEAGTILLRRANRIFLELEAAQSELDEYSGLERGTVRAGAIHWLEPFDLPGLLHAFSTSYPDIAVDLREHDARDMFTMLADGRMDLVFSNISPADRVPSGLQRRLLFSEPLVVGVHPDHHLANRTSARLAELRSEPFVAFRHGSAFRDTVDAALANAGETPSVRYESSDLMMVRNLVAKGLGVALMPESLTRAPGAAISSLAIAPDAPERTVGLTWRSDLSPSPPARAFLALALKWLEAK